MAFEAPANLESEHLKANAKLGKRRNSASVSLLGAAKSQNTLSTRFDIPYEERWQQRVGEGVRFFCHSKYGYGLQIGVNLTMLISNLFLIVYDLFYLKPFSYSAKASPDWFITCDIIIVLVLFVEVAVRFAEYEFSCRSYFREARESVFGNLGDVFVLAVSIAVLIIYFYENDVTTRAQDNLSLLFVRIFRDIVRLFRCIWFMFTLYESVVVFESIEDVSWTRFKPRLQLFASQNFKSSTSYGTFQEGELLIEEQENFEEPVVI